MENTADGTTCVAEAGSSEPRRAHFNLEVPPYPFECICVERPRNIWRGRSEVRSSRRIKFVKSMSKHGTRRCVKR